MIIGKYLNNFYNFKIFIRKFGINYLCGLYLCHQVLKITRHTLWGDEIAKAWQTCPLVSGVGITG